MLLRVLTAPHASTPRREAGVVGGNHASGPAPRSDQCPTAAHPGMAHTAHSTHCTHRTHRTHHTHLRWSSNTLWSRHIRLRLTPQKPRLPAEHTARGGPGVGTGQGSARGSRGASWSHLLLFATWGLRNEETRSLACPMHVMDSATLEPRPGDGPLKRNLGAPGQDVAPRALRADR